MSPQRLRFLALEASASPPSVALYNQEQILTIEGASSRAQADQLLAMVDEVLAQSGITLQQIDGFVCGCGPGSFTGLRVAAATVQGLAYTTAKPVAMISSLAALAMSALDEDSSEPSDPVQILACMDARKQQVYGALFERLDSGSVCLMEEEFVCDPEQLPISGLASGAYHLGVGNGFTVYPALRQYVKRLAAAQVPHAQAAVQLAIHGYAGFKQAYLATPVYIRDNVADSSVLTNDWKTKKGKKK